MQKFGVEEALITVQLQQLLAEFGYEVDVNYGHNITDLYTEDGIFDLGATTYAGHAQIRGFYTEREKYVRANQKDGERQVLHAFTNLRATIQDADHATLRFFNVNYSAEGARPVKGPIAPTMIAECGMECRRCADGQWRITRFDGQPAFVGEDGFLNKMVVPKS